MILMVMYFITLILRDSHMVSSENMKMSRALSMLREDRIEVVAKFYRVGMLDVGCGSSYMDYGYILSSVSNTAG